MCRIALVIKWLQSEEEVPNTLRYFYKFHLPTTTIWLQKEEHLDESCHYGFS